MAEFGLSYGAAAGALAVVFALGFGAALLRREAALVDAVWGVGFLAAAWCGFALGGGPLWRRALVASLTSLWGVRLSLYLGRRRLRARREDPRYAAYLAQHGGWRPATVAVYVFALQALLVAAVALPLVAACAGTMAVGPGDWLGAALFLGGTVIEAVADRQLERFKRLPEQRGKVMDRGLWRYSRHPNYFGEFLCWWGAFALALQAAHAWWAVVSPLLMSVLLLRISGKDRLERYLAARPGYRDYSARTSGFLPLPPRGQRR